MIYQSAYLESEEEKKAFIDHIKDLEYNKLQIGEPNIVLYLSAPFDLVTKLRIARKNNEGIANDNHESNQEFLKLVHLNADFVAIYQGWHVINCAAGNNDIRSINDIHEDIYTVVRKVINESNREKNKTLQGD